MSDRKSLAAANNRFYKMDIVKSKEECTKEYILALRKWLTENCDEFFNDENNRACSYSDFVYFNKTTDREHLVMPDEVMLVDRDWEGQHNYVICTVSKTNKCRDLFRVLPIDDVRGKHWRNGYFLLPRIPPPPNE